MRKALRSLKEWLRVNRPRPLGEIWADVLVKLRGHYAYFGVSDNGPWLRNYRQAVLGLLYRWLNRRSQKRSFTWPTFYAYVDAHPLNPPMRLVNLNSAFV